MQPAALQSAAGHAAPEQVAPASAGSGNGKRPGAQGNGAAQGGRPGVQSTGSFRPARVRTTSDEGEHQHEHHRGHPPAFLGGHSSDHLMPGGHALGYDDRGLTYGDMHTDVDEEVQSPASCNAW